MSLKDRIQSDFVVFMKARDELRTSCLRMVKAAIKNKEMEKAGVEIDDAVVILILNNLSKRAQESIEQFEKGGRRDLVEKEKAELVVIRSYLPQALSAEELSILVEQAIKESGAVGPTDMGRVMKLLTPKTVGRADGKIVSALVQEKLRGRGASTPHPERSPVK